MKIPKVLLLLSAAFASLVAVGGLTPTHARADVSVSFFYDTLDPYGEWVQTADYGYCWHPTGVDENWAPYSDGYWAYTDSGWTWVSYEDYGGVVYHYGRWAHLPDEGWVWVPGNTWAPAWVSWRTNDDYIGWAPLPPEARWHEGVGFSTWVDARFDIGPGFYSFVGVRDFGAPALGAVIVNREQNVTIINNTTNITNITVNNSNVYVGGPNYARISARTARPIPTLKLVRQGDTASIRSAGGKALSRQQGNQLVVLAPRITPSTGTRLAPSKVAKTLTSAKADHGWGGVKDPQEREKLQAQIKSQSTGSETVKPVNPEDLKLADQKIKTGGASNSATGTGLTSETPKVPKGKAGKNKTPSTADLLNAPATEEPGAASPAETPKTAKTGKGKKSHAATESSFLDTTGASPSGEATPASKKSKSKKSKTPSDYQSGSTGSADEGVPTPSKHSKSKSSDTNLQPFMSGDGSSSGGTSSEPKSKKYSDEETGSSKSKYSETPKDSETSKTYEGRSSESGYPGSQARTPKGDKSGKGDKSDKKSKSEEAYTPGQ